MHKYKLNEYAKLMCNLYVTTLADAENLRILLSDWYGLSDKNVDAVLKQSSKLLDDRYYWIGSGDNE